MKILASLAATAAVAYANVNAGRKLFICTTPQPNDLDATGFAALSWVQVGGVGNHGETGSTTNILTYDTWDTDVSDKAKGVTNAGDPDVEVAYNANDLGQQALRAAALTRFKYAFKIEGNDKPNADVDSTNTIRYNRGLVTGPRQPNGAVEDFDLEIFTLGLVQRQITVPAVDGTTIP